MFGVFVRKGMLPFLKRKWIIFSKNPGKVFENVPKNKGETPRISSYTFAVNSRTLAKESSKWESIENDISLLRGFILDKFLRFILAAQNYFIKTSEIIFTNKIKKTHRIRVENSRWRRRNPFVENSTMRTQFFLIEFSYLMLFHHLRIKP